MSPEVGPKEFWVFYEVSTGVGGGVGGGGVHQTTLERAETPLLLPAVNYSEGEPPSRQCHLNRHK